jgi:hypothetical protein
MIALLFQPLRIEMMGQVPLSTHPTNEYLDPHIVKLPYILFFYFLLINFEIFCYSFVIKIPNFQKATQFIFLDFDEGLHMRKYS